MSPRPAYPHLGGKGVAYLFTFEHKYETQLHHPLGFPRSTTLLPVMTAQQDLQGSDQVAVRLLERNSLQRVTPRPRLHGSFVLFICLQIELQRQSDWKDGPSSLLNLLESCGRCRFRLVDAIDLDPVGGGGDVKVPVPSNHSSVSFMI